MARDEHDDMVDLILSLRLNVWTSRGDSILASFLNQAPHALNKPSDSKALIQPIAFLRALPLPKQPQDCTIFEFEM